MIYFVGGLLASTAMLLYRRPPARSSPLWSISLQSPSLSSRLRGGGGIIAARFGIVLSFLVLFSIAALRYGIGTDYWARYAPLFQQIQAGDAHGQEAGFVLINTVVGQFTDDYQWLFVVVSFLTIALFYRFFVRMSVNPALSVYIYAFGGFYLEEFNLIKQGLAIAVLVNTIELAVRKKHVAFVVLTLLAASIHTSALVWFAVWPLMCVRLRRWIRISVALTMVLVILLAPQVFSTLAAELAPTYAWYFDSNYGVTRSIHPAVLMVTFGVFVFTMATIGTSQRGDRYADAVVNLVGVSTAVLVATVTIAYSFSRLNYYFAPAQLIAVPFALSLVRSMPIRRAISLLFMAAYMTSFIFQFIVWNAHGVLPYESVFTR